MLFSDILQLKSGVDKMIQYAPDSNICKCLIHTMNAPVFLENVEPLPLSQQKQHYNSIFQSFVQRTKLLWWTNRLSQLIIKKWKIVNLTDFCVSRNLKSDGIKQINIKLDVYMSAFQSCVLISLADGCMRQTDLQWTYFFRLRWDRDKKWLQDQT